MSADKVRYPGPGCLVEYLQGNSPMQAIVLEEQNGRLRLYAVNRRESSLSSGRLLPWAGPALGSGLSRQQMDEALEERRGLRLSLAADISSLDVWDLTQGEVPKASAEWLAGLLWTRPSIDQEAALGHALLGARPHFRFSPPDFEIVPQDVVNARLAETESARKREAFAVTGAQFFQTLWDVHARKRGPLTPQELPEESLAAKLRELLLDRMADPEAVGDAAVWKLLVKGLPDVPHIALLLAVAWNLVPEHHNFLLDRAGYDSGEAWADAFSDDCRAVRDESARMLAALDAENTPFVSVDPAGSKDRDDAFFVRRHEDGGFTVTVALACPAVAWPFDSPLDKAVLRRASSLYLPEGNEHMLPAGAGRDLFSLDAGTVRPALLATLRLSSHGDVVEITPSLVAASDFHNLDLESCEAALLCVPDGVEAPSAAVPAHVAMLQTGLALARLLQARRIADGAVITEGPDPEVIVEGSGVETRVRIEKGPEASLSHLLVGELMVLCNSSLATWGRDRGIPLLYRTQDVALPREFAGVWTEAHEISRVVRALPPASLESAPKRHAGLGLGAYATFSSPIRRYTDLVNQGQIVAYLLSGRPRFDAFSLASLLPLLSARSDAATQVQRLRPRYWKLVFFRQQGEKQWWDAVVADENEAFASIALPWAQLMVRGKRRQFGEKMFPGMRVQVRLGKVNPLSGEIQVLEARET
jgi:exoribonuclease-2